MCVLISWIESILFVFLLFQVGYLTLFAVASNRRAKQYSSRGSSKSTRFAVFFPAYKEDSVIVSSISDFLNQDYPKELFDIYVLSDQMKENTLFKLSQLPIHIVPINLKEGSKAKALSIAVGQIEQSENQYDFAVIMDADNLACPDFLKQIDESVSLGYKAVQGHRVAKNIETSTAILDAMSEEINNSIFRQGQVNLGFSSALIGSGMALEYSWFKNHIQQIESMGEDKEFERMLLAESIYTEYLPKAYVYDEKISTQSGFYNQRRRWIAAQFYTVKISIKDLPIAIMTGNRDYINKILQWMLLPRIILLGLLIFMSFTTLFLHFSVSIKWWFLTILMAYTLALATPNYLITKQFKKSMFSLPSLFLLMFANLFRIKGANKKFIHTEHKH